MPAPRLALRLSLNNILTRTNVSPTPGLIGEVRMERRTWFGGRPIGRVSRWPILSCQIQFAGNRIAYLIRSASRNS